MQYVFNCPAQGCNFSVKVETENSDWATEKITEVSLFHHNHAHPKMTPITSEQIRTLVIPIIEEG
ncbi:MAG: hypothetical protein IBX72_06835 [Nitrospirae bacterium]|nr:hypothetical protein [Nitrospirota bacterium]